jgi:hypothetical protein
VFRHCLYILHLQMKFVEIVLKILLQQRSIFLNLILYRKLAINFKDFLNTFSHIDENYVHLLILHLRRLNILIYQLNHILSF